MHHGAILVLVLFVSVPLPPYHLTIATQSDADLASRAVWARWLLLSHPDVAAPAFAADDPSSSSAAASIATLVLLLAVSGLLSAR